jgi:TolA-binding protein
MRRSNQVFYIFCLVLTTGISWAYFLFAGYFNSGWEDKREIAQLKESLEDSQFQVAMLNHQMKDLEQTVASVLPAEKIAKNYPFDSLMKTLRAPASIPAMDLSSVVFERGSKFYNEKKYNLAITEFKKLIEQYPSSALQIEARFMMAESLFMQRDFKKCVDAINDMVLLYPDDVHTGLALIRLGQISEHNNQTEEAQEIYHTVYNNFNDKSLKEQAQTLMKSLELQ